MRINIMSWKEFGLGVLVGASGSAIIHHLLMPRSPSKELQQLTAAIKGLQREWKELLATISSSDSGDGNREAAYVDLRRLRPGSSTPAGSNRIGMNRGTNSEIASVHASTSDDEDELDFEEAYEGFTSPVPYKDTRQRGFESIARSADELTIFLSEMDQLFSGSQSDHQEALRRMLAQSEFSSSKDYLWRLARAKVLVSEVRRIEGDDEERKRLVFEARENARAAIELDEELSDSHKYYAITQGIITDWVSFTEAASLGKEYKKHMERALELKPNEPYLNHLYGRFLFSIANLSWMQRKAAILMYALPQSLSLDDALVWFDKAEDLKPGFSNLNPFYSAKCYIAKGQTEIAVEFLQKAISYAGSSFEEEEVRKEAAQLLQQYQ